MIRWGIQLDFKIELGNTFLVSVSELGPNDYIVCSANQTYIFARNKLIGTFPYCFALCEYIKELDIVFGVTIGITTLCAFTPKNPKEFLFKDIPLNQTVVNQIYYTHVSKKLITVGSDVRIWNILKSNSFDILEPRYRVELVRILPSDPFCNSINHAYIDELRERIIIPSSSGFTQYHFDGTVVSSIPRLSAYAFNSITVLTAPRRFPGIERQKGSNLNQFKRFLAADTSGNIRIWHRSGKMLRAFPSSKGTVLFIQFITSEFVVSVDTGGDVRIIDVKTGKISYALKIEFQPGTYRLFTKPDRLIFLVGNAVYVYNITLLWNLWFRPLEFTSSIERFPSSVYRGRIAFVTIDGGFTLISPKTKMQIGTAESPTTLRPYFYAYDREFKDDQLMVTMEDGSVHYYQLTKNGFDLLKEEQLKAQIAINVRGFKDLKWIICVFTLFGDLVVLEQDTFRQIYRVPVDQFPAKFVFWYKPLNILLAITSMKLVIIDLVNMKSIYSTQFRCPNQAVFEEGRLFVSYDHGFACFYEISSRGFQLVTEARFAQPIVQISMKYGYHTFVLKSKQVIIGNREKPTLYTIQLPFDVYAAGFMNFNLDLLVALDKEIMIINHKNFKDAHAIFVNRYDSDEGKDDPLAIELTWNKFDFDNMPEYQPYEFLFKNSELEVIFKILSKIRDEEDDEGWQEFEDYMIEINTGRKKLTPAERRRRNRIAHFRHQCLIIQGKIPAPPRKKQRAKIDIYKVLGITEDDELLKPKPEELVTEEEEEIDSPRHNKRNNNKSRKLSKSMSKNSLEKAIIMGMEIPEPGAIKKQKSYNKFIEKLSTEYDDSLPDITSHKENRKKVKEMLKKSLRRKSKAKPEDEIVNEDDYEEVDDDQANEEQVKVNTPSKGKTKKKIIKNENQSYKKPKNDFGDYFDDEFDDINGEGEQERGEGRERSRKRSRKRRPSELLHSQSVNNLVDQEKKKNKKKLRNEFAATDGEDEYYYSEYESDEDLDHTDNGDSSGSRKRKENSKKSREHSPKQSRKLPPGLPRPHGKDSVHYQTFPDNQTQGELEMISNNVNPPPRNLTLYEAALTASQMEIHLAENGGKLSNGRYYKLGSNGELIEISNGDDTLPPLVLPESMLRMKNKGGKANAKAKKKKKEKSNSFTSRMLEEMESAAKTARAKQRNIHEPLIPSYGPRNLHGLGMGRRPNTPENNDVFSNGRTALISERSEQLWKKNQPTMKLSFNNEPAYISIFEVEAESAAQRNNDFVRHSLPVLDRRTKTSRNLFRDEIEDWSTRETWKHRDPSKRGLSLLPPVPSIRIPRI